MQLLSSDQRTKYIENIIHEDTQLHAESLDLTVKSIERLTTRGSLDFGGSEFNPAETEMINSKKKNPEDDYGWWNLDSGTYKAAFNEKLNLDEHMLAIIEPHVHARKAGLQSSSYHTSGNIDWSFIFHIPEVGCDIKENARIATVYVLETQ